MARIVATSFPRHADGLSRPGPSLAVVSGHGVTFYLLSLAPRTVPVGLAHAIWSGAGIVLVSLAGWLIFRQPIDAPGLLGVAPIPAGVLVMNVFSESIAH